MIITINLFLNLYLALLLIYAIFSIFNLYHMFKFGLNRHAAYIGTIVFIGGVLMILGTSFFFIAQIDWSTEVTLFNYNKTYFTPYAE
jgi:small-conductance mechanosensitive channel